MNGTCGEDTAIRKMMKKLIIYTDGACRGNPGPAGIGIVICNESGEIIKEDKEFIGNATNNIAEYRALIKALERANDFSVNRVECFSDSELMVKQLNGAYRVKKLKNLIPIRNAIMHSRGQYLSEETISRLKESCFELQKIIEKVRKGAFQK